MLKQLTLVLMLLAGVGAQTTAEECVIKYETCPTQSISEFCDCFSDVVSCVLLIEPEYCPSISGNFKNLLNGCRINPICWAPINEDSPSCLVCGDPHVINFNQLIYTYSFTAETELYSSQTITITSTANKLPNHYYSVVNATSVSFNNQTLNHPFTPSDNKVYRSGTDYIIFKATGELLSLTPDGKCLVIYGYTNSNTSGLCSQYIPNDPFRVLSETNLCMGQTKEICDRDQSLLANDTAMFTGLLPSYGSMNNILQNRIQLSSSLLLKPLLVSILGLLISALGLNHLICLT